MNSKILKIKIQFYIDNNELSEENIKFLKEIIEEIPEKPSKEDITAIFFKWISFFKDLATLYNIFNHN